MSSLVPREEFKKNLIEIIESAVEQDPKVLRFKDMLLDSFNYGDNHHTNPKSISFEISSTGETAYQRAILKSEKTLLNFKRENGFETVQWMDGELPIVLNKNPRRNSVDLVGSLDDIPTLCELKFGTSRNSDSPLYAAIELLTYYCFIQFNADILDKYEVFHKNLKPFKWSVFATNGFPRLIICANKSYWDAWFCKFDKVTLRNQVFEWGMKLDTNINLFQSEDFDFKSQKREGKYTPTIPINCIWEIIKF
jgi:hypothetical protein